MKVRFGDNRLERLEADGKFMGGYPSDIVRAFRKRMQMIRSAPDERVFWSLKSLHYEKLEGKRDHQRSMRLNDQWRLVLEVEELSDEKGIVVVTIEDYHG